MRPRLWRRLAHSRSRPERFGRYVLLDRIGAGGMAEVFRAVMPGAQGFRRTFVVKRILAERSQRADFVDMFVRGGAHRLAAQPPEHRAGVRLRQRRRRLLPGDGVPARARRAVGDAQAARSRTRSARRAGGGLHRARGGRRASATRTTCVGADGKRLNIVHRDVSPSNIMCLRTGGVKLLDFGIAKAARRGQREKTEQGLFKGKLAYIAPERIKNEPLDGRVDLFALGVVLWEMLAGRRLFRGKSELQTLTNVLEMQVPPPSSHAARRARVAGRDRRCARSRATATSATRRARRWPTIWRRCCARPNSTRGCCPDLLREAFGFGPVEEPGDDVERDARDVGVADGVIPRPATGRSPPVKTSRPHRDVAGRRRVGGGVAAAPAVALGGLAGAGRRWGVAAPESGETSRSLPALRRRRRWPSPAPMPAQAAPALPPAAERAWQPAPERLERTTRRQRSRHRRTTDRPQGQGRA